MTIRLWLHDRSVARYEKCVVLSMDANSIEFRGCEERYIPTKHLEPQVRVTTNLKYLIETPSKAGE
jgi:hypothetical protein